jgi:hypothetical protein
MYLYHAYMYMYLSTTSSVHVIVTWPIQTSKCCRQNCSTPATTTHTVCLEIFARAT